MAMFNQHSRWPLSGSLEMIREINYEFFDKWILDGVRPLILLNDGATSIIQEGKECQQGTT